MIVPHVFLGKQKSSVEYDLTHVNSLTLEMNTREKKPRKTRALRFLSSDDTEQESRISSVLRTTVELIFDALLRL